LNRPHSFQLLALLPLLLATLAACTPDAPQPEGSADIAVSAQALSTSDVARVSLTVSATDISPSLVTNLQSTGGQWRAVLGAIPAGANRTFLAQAFDSSNTKVYEGQASGVTITSNATAAVVIVLQQTTAPTPFVNSAPKITGLTASADHVDINESVTLAVTDTDADGDARGYAWTASGGTFDDATKANPTWTAPATEGTYTLNVSVTDGKGGQAGISLKLAVVRARGAANVTVAFNTWPVATQVTGTPSGQVAPRGVVNLDVAAVDADNDALSYLWNDGGCGGSFSGTALKSPTWTAPASVPSGGVCRLTVGLNDGRGGSTTGQLSINVGLPQSATMPPVVDEVFQSTDTVAVNGTVNLLVRAHDPEGAAITFTWSMTSGTLGTQVDSASQSEVTWTAPATGASSTITLVIQDASGQKTTQTFPITLTGGVMQTCVKVVTSRWSKVSPYSSPVTVNYSMVGGAGGGCGYDWVGGSGTKVSGSFTLAAGANLEVFVGGGGGWGAYYVGGIGAGGAGYYGGGGGGLSSNGGGAGGGGGSSAILQAGQLVAAAAGGSGAFNGGGGGSTVGGAAGGDSRSSVKPTAGTLGAGGNTSQASGGSGFDGGAASNSIAGGGGGYGGGGGVSGGAGGTAGASAINGGLGANTWSSATTLPAAAGTGSANGGNAGLVILTYTALSCM
jgi:hypothetical protein